MEFSAQQATMNTTGAAVPNRIFLLSALVADAALLCAPFTMLAFQSVRIDGYDPEKTQLIGILVAIIFGAQLPRLINESIRWLYTRRRSLQRRQPVIIPPLLIVVVGLFAVALLSTILSLSSSLSFLGEPSRAQGLLALFYYIVLFLQATQIRQRIRTTLIPVLLMTAVPVCLWMIIQFVQGADRLLLGSSAGNPNFLSSWIVMVLLYTGPQLYRQVRQWQRPFIHRQWQLIVFYTIPSGLLLICLLINASRGALLGLSAGILFCFVTLAASGRRRNRIIIGGLALLVMLTSYGAISLWVTKLDNVTPNGLTRLFMPYDPVRVSVWGDASTIVSLQADPVFTISRQPDSLALLRPIVGYGPETVEQLQSRFGKLGGGQVIVNSFHNIIFDTLITQGWLGLLTLVLLLECVLYGGLKFLGLITYGQIKPLIAWQLGGSALGVMAAMLLIPGSSIGALWPLGVGLGSIAGLLLWLGRQALTTRPAVAILADEQKTLVMAILAVFIAQWIDNQLGFAQASTQPLWWLLLGLLGTAIYPSMQAMGALKNQSALVECNSSMPGILLPSLPAMSWLFATLISGLFVIHSLGNLLHSQLTNVEVGSPDILLVMIFTIGMIGYVLHKPTTNASTEKLKQTRSLSLRVIIFMLGLIGVWGVFFLIKTALITLSGAQLDMLMTTDDPALANHFIAAINPLALHGILLALVAVLIMVGFQRLANHSADQIPTRPVYLNGLHLIVTMSLLVIAIAVACIFYSKQYSSGVLHNLGNSVAQNAQLVPDSPDLILATAAFEAAATESPTNVLLRLHWATAISVRINVTLNPTTNAALHSQLKALLAAIFRDQPFFVNTIEWLTYSENFGSH